MHVWFSRLIILFNVFEKNKRENEMELYVHCVKFLSI